VSRWECCDKYIPSMKLLVNVWFGMFREGGNGCFS